MTRRLTPRHRRTLLRRNVGGSLLVSGLVGRPGVVGCHLLRTLADSDMLGDTDARVVLLADFFSAVRLDAGAELIMWHGTDGSRNVTPIRRLLDDSATTMLLGGSDQAALPRWTDPVTLRSPILPGPGVRGIVAVSALTFAEFVGAVR